MERDSCTAVERAVSYTNFKTVQHQILAQQ
jgi:hypothetical protein